MCSRPIGYSALPSFEGYSFKKGEVLKRPHSLVCIVYNVLVLDNVLHFCCHGVVFYSVVAMVRVVAAPSCT